MAIEMFDSNHDYESESEEEEVCPSCDKIINADENPCGPGCPLYDEGLEDSEEEVRCWTCDKNPATHSTFRDALGENELTCDKCHREEYPENE